MPPTRLAQTIGQYDPITLPEMHAVALLNRTDTKYLLRADQLCRALGQLGSKYRVLQVDGARLNRYQTLYFDTPDLALYRRHHAGGRNRYKVRYREYVDSELYYLEVKFKTNKNRTIKSRRRARAVRAEFGGRELDFVRAHFPYDVQALRPALWNEFTRITLVSKRRVERLTLDLHLRFWHNEARASLPGIAVAEVKQQGFSLRSDFIGQMRALNLRPTGFSKYCMGVSKLYPGVKSNNFKPRQRLVDKLLERKPS